MKTNMHRVDELAWIRAEISELKKREDAIRAEIIDHADDLDGEFHRASIVAGHTRRLNMKRLAEAVPNLDEFYDRINFHKVSLEKLSRQAEAAE